MRHCVMMSVVKAFKCNDSVLRPTIWYWNSFVVRLGFLFQPGVFYNTLHRGHLKDNRKQSQRLVTQQMNSISKCPEKLQEVKRLFLWQYSVLHTQHNKIGIHDRPLCVCEKWAQKLFLSIPPSPETMEACHMKMSYLGICERASLLKVENSEDRIPVGTHRWTISYPSLFKIT